MVPATSSSSVWCACNDRQCGSPLQLLRGDVFAAGSVHAPPLHHAPSAPAAAARARVAAMASSPVRRAAYVLAGQPVWRLLGRAAAGSSAAPPVPRSPTPQFRAWRIAAAPEPRRELFWLGQPACWGCMPPEARRQRGLCPFFSPLRSFPALGFEQQLEFESGERLSDFPVRSAVPGNCMRPPRKAAAFCLSNPPRSLSRQAVLPAAQPRPPS